MSGGSVPMERGLEHPSTAGTCSPLVVRVACGKGLAWGIGLAWVVWIRSRIGGAWVIVLGSVIVLAWVIGLACVIRIHGRIVDAWVIVLVSEVVVARVVFARAIRGWSVVQLGSCTGPGKDLRPLGLAAGHTRPLGPPFPPAVGTEVACGIQAGNGIRVVSKTSLVAEHTRLLGPALVFACCCAASPTGG